MYAIIATGGKQYKVAENEVIQVEKLLGKEGDVINFDKVLMIGGDGDAKVGRPYIDGANVEGEIVEQGKEKKVLVLKKKRRKGYKKAFGHRQCFTAVRVSKINV